MPANNGAANSSNSEDTTMTQKFTISARNADRFLGDDEHGMLTQKQRDTFRLALASHYALGAADVGIDDVITDGDVAETLDTVEDFFVAHGRKLTRSGERPAVPAELRKTAHGALLVWDEVQARKGARRGTLYVMDCGTARAAYFDGEA